MAYICRPVIFFHTKHIALRNSSLLWKLEGDALPGPSYLFGTMHVRDRRAFQQLATVYEKIGECGGFAAEFHLESTDHDFDAGAMQLPAGQRLSSFYTPKKYKKYRSILLKSTGLDIAQFDHALPFVVLNLATEQLLQQDMPEPLDQHLWSFAKAAGKTLHGIETFREQMEVLRKISLEEQLNMLGGMCKNISRFRHYLLRLTELYEANEVQQLYKLVKRNTKGMRQLMLYRRNEVMAERISGLVREQRMFVAIGAAHLSGGKGVLRLLKHAGFKLTPIRMANPTNLLPG